jgi:hypothetical protein
MSWHKFITKNGYMFLRGKKRLDAIRLHIRSSKLRKASIAIDGHVNARCVPMGVKN